MTLRVAARTECGPVREHNEDSLFVDEARGLFLVADGMGGHAAGEVASALAVRVVADDLAAFLASATYPYPEADVRAALGGAARHANDAILAKGMDAPGAMLGMGTTLTVLVVLGTRYLIAHVGDSRAYLLRGGALTRITRDHSYVEELVQGGLLSEDEARVHPKRNLITRSLGTQTSVEIDFFAGDLLAGDVLLLCTDGLSGELGPPAIQTLLAERGPDPAAAVDGLIEAAIRAGGRDNATAVVVRVEG